MRRVLTVLGVLLGLALAAVAPVLAAGDAEVGMVDTNTGRWHLREPDGSDRSFFYGNPGDIPVLGDWDCDGVDTPGMFRPANGFFYLTNNNPPDGGVGLAEISFFFGIGGDLPLVGDWDGDGCDSVGIYRNGQAFLTNGLVTAAAELQFFFGVPGDRPFAGDWDGDGIDTVGIYRDSRGQIFYTNENPAGPVATTANDFFYGIPSDRFMPGDWNGDGIDTVGIFRPTESRFYLRNVNSTGPADETIDFGQSSWTPLGGDHELREASLSAPASIEPGPVGVNGTGTTTFSLGFVGDSGDADIRITEVTFFGPNADELSVAPISDADIGFGESRTVEITIAPKVVGVRRSYVRIVHTGVGSPLIIPVVGEGSYRVNAGGDPIEDWSADDPFSPGGSVGPAAATTVSGPTAPNAVFESYRFGQQAWDFPVTPGSYRVNLYFAETFPGTQAVGARQFDVTIEGTKVLTNFDIFASAGANNGIVRTFDVFSDVNLDIDLTQVVNSPAIQGIEIIPTPSWKTVGSSPSTAVFGSIAVGDAISRTITVVHAGEPTTASVNLQAATVVGSDSGEFSILSGGAARTLAAGGSSQVVVEYRPAGAGIADARLFIAHDGPNSPLEVDLVAAADDVILYRLNAGGDAVIGQFSWIADDPYLVPGTPSGEFALVEAINTSSQSLPPGTPLSVLRTERFGSTFQALSYDLPLADGAYEVRLYVVEPVHTAAGVRVFDVNVEGALAINDLDIYARAGKNKAIMIPVRANVTGGVLDIDLIPIAGKNLPAVHGIEVVREVGTAVLGSDPVSLTLGPISAAGSTTGEVEIVHTGGAGNPSIVIDSVAIGGPNALRFQIVSGLQAGDVFPAGTSAPTVIRFTAGWPGEKAATLEISYNGGTSLSVPLVGSVNDPPVVPTLVNQSVNEGVVYSRTIVATDPDADFLTMTATGLPAWASITAFDDGTITIGGTPGFEDAGSSSVSVTATDPDGAADTESFTLTVANVNRAPTFNQNLGNRTDSEGNTVSIASEATDLDGNVLTWSATGLPQGITINSTSGLMTGTIGFLAADNQPGGGYPVVVTVRDNGSPNLTDTDSFQWSISNANRAPTANNVGPGVLEGGSVTFTVTGSDPDGDSLTFALFGGGPSNGTITAGPTQVTATSASITYLHNGSETLSDSFQFTVNDGTTTSAPATVSVVVTPQNDPPVATATAPAGGFETQSVAFSGSGSDVDGTIASYAWTFGDGGTSTLQNPTHVYASAGTYNGSLVVTDNGGAASAPDPFTIVIDDLFLLTVQKAGTGTGTVTGVGITCGGDCSDLYRSGLDVTLSAAPDAGSSFVGWSGVPGCAGTGDCTITMSANTTVTATFNDIPQPPVANDANPGVLEGGSVTFTVTGSDPDGDSLTFALFGGGPSNGTITAGPTQVTATSASITYLHNGSETLSDSFQFTVNDGTTTSAPATVSVVVTPQNDPPVVTAPGDQTYTLGAPITPLVIAGTDVDGSITSTDVTGLPTGLSSSDSGDFATVTGTPTVPTGAVTVTITVTDNVGATGTDTFTITVPPDVTAPTFAGTVTASGATVSTIDLSWPVASDAESGVLEYRITGSPGIGTVTIGFGTNSTTLTGLSPSTSYTFTVVAVDNASNVSAGLVSNALSTLTPPDVTAPTFAGTVTASGATVSTIDLSWPVASDAESGVLEYRITGSPGIGTVTIGFGTNSTTLTGLSPSTSYTFTVVAVDNASNVSAGLVSNALSTLTPPDVTAPTFAGTVTASGATVSTIDLSWPVASDAESGVLEYRITGSPGIGTVTIGFGTNSTTLTGLSPSTSYTFTVVAVDNASNVSAGLVSNALSTLTPPDVTAPTFAGTVTASGATVSTIDLSWPVASDAESGVLEYRITGSPGIGTVTIGFGTNSTTLTGLSPSTSYTFTVVAVDNASNVSAGLVSNALSTLTPPDVTAPTFAGTVTASGATVSTIDLSWPVASDAESGVLEYRITGSPGIGTVTIGFGTNSTTLTGLSPSTSYTFTVVAVDNASNVSAGLVSNALSTLTPPDVTAPTFAGTVTASGATVSTIDLSWPVASDAESGVLEYRITGSPGIGTVTIGFGTNSTTLTGLSPSTSYTFTVVAVDNASNVSAGLVSNALSTLTPPDVTAPTFAGTVTASGATVSTIDLSWPVASDAESGVLEYRITGSPGIGTVTIGFGTNSTTLTGLSPSTSYTFTVVAVDNASNVSAGLVSNALSTLTPPDVTAPTFAGTVTASGATVSTIDLSWPVASDAESGVLEYRITGSPGIGTVTIGFGTNSTTLTGLSPSTSYTFTVVAVDNASNVSAGLVSNALSTL